MTAGFAVLRMVPGARDLQRLGLFDQAGMPGDGPVARRQATRALRAARPARLRPQRLAARRGSPAREDQSDPGRRRPASGRWRRGAQPAPARRPREVSSRSAASRPAGGDGVPFGGDRVPLGNHRVPVGRRASRSAATRSLGVDSPSGLRGGSSRQPATRRVSSRTASTACSDGVPVKSLGTSITWSPGSRPARIPQRRACAAVRQSSSSRGSGRCRRRAAIIAVGALARRRARAGRTRGGRRRVHGAAACPGSASSRA